MRRVLKFPHYMWGGWGNFFYIKIIVSSLFPAIFSILLALPFYLAKTMVTYFNFIFCVHAKFNCYAWHVTSWCIEHHATNVGAGHNLLLKSKQIKLREHKSLMGSRSSYVNNDLHMNQSFHCKVVRCELIVLSLDAVWFESHVVLSKSNLSPPFSSRNNILSHWHKICTRSIVQR